MFGFEDNLLHKLASITNLFTANHMQERFWPVHVFLPSLAPRKKEINK